MTSSVARIATTIGTCGCVVLAGCASHPAHHTRANQQVKVVHATAAVPIPCPVRATRSGDPSAVYAGSCKVPGNRVAKRVTLGHANSTSASTPAPSSSSRQRRRAHR